MIIVVGIVAINTNPREQYSLKVTSTITIITKIVGCIFGKILAKTIEAMAISTLVIISTRKFIVP